MFWSLSNLFTVFCLISVSKLSISSEKLCIERQKNIKVGSSWRSRFLRRHARLLSRNLSVADWSEFGLWTGASPRCLLNHSLGLLWVIQCVLEHFRVHVCIVMAFKEVFVLFAFFVCSTSATTCTYGSLYNNCDYDESCCLDGVCREKCSGCTYNSECGTYECCDSSDGYCYDCSVLKTPAIVGIVFGCLVVTAIVISIVACFCCACCPYYRILREITNMMRLFIF